MYIYIYKQDVALNNQQWLICHKTQPNQTYLIYMYKENLALNNLQWLIYHKMDKAIRVQILDEVAGISHNLWEK